MRRPFILVPLLVLAASLGAPAAADDAGEVFTRSTSHADVWVSTWLAEHRSGAAYTPLLVVVRNRDSDSAMLDREAFHLVEHGGIHHPLASLGEIRGNYQKATFDRSMGRFYGIPIGTTLDMDDLVPSNFFPVLSLAGEIRDDEVLLPTGRWMVDLLYFRTPTTVLEKPAALEVRAEAWEEPVRVAVSLE